MERDKLIEEMARAIWSVSLDGPWRECTIMAHDCKIEASAALSRLDDLGLCVVPKEPTHAMVMATRQHHAEDVYRAMIAVATSTPQS